MWWSEIRRRTAPDLIRGLALPAIALVAACGFTPVYGPGGAAQGLFGAIDVAQPRDVGGYLLVEQLERRLGLPDGAPRYALTADIRMDEVGLGITPDQEITRIRLRGSADYTLTDSATNTVATVGRVQNFTSYSAPVFSSRRNTVAGNSVTVQVAKDDAIARLMVILADQIVAELLATAPDWRAAP